MVSCTAISLSNGVETHIPLHSHNPEEQTIMRMCHTWYESLYRAPYSSAKSDYFAESIIDSHINRSLVRLFFWRVLFT